MDLCLERSIFESLVVFPCTDVTIALKCGCVCVCKFKFKFKFKSSASYVSLSCTNRIKWIFLFRQQTKKDEWVIRRKKGKNELSLKVKRSERERKEYSIVLDARNLLL